MRGQTKTAGGARSQSQSKYRCMYLILQLKRAVRASGYVLAGSAILCLLLGIIAFVAVNTLYKDTVMGRMQVAVVQQDQDAISGMAVQMISAMDSVKSFCDFVPMDEQQARRKLEQGEVYAALIFPRQLLQGIMDGTNIPAVILLPRKQGLEGAVFRELADSGGKLLAAAQTGIYAAADYCYLNEKTAQIPVIEERLNRLYLSYAMDSGERFKTIEASATGELTVTEHYLASGIVLLLLLAGIPCAVLLKKESRTLTGQLGLAGIGAAWRNIVSILSVAAVLLLTTVIIGAAGGLIYYLAAGELLRLSAVGACSFLLVVLSAAGLIVFLCRAAGNPVAGVMLIFLTAVILVFCAGGFVPGAFLPAGLQEAVWWNPAAILIRQTGSILSNVYMAGNTGLTLLMGLLFGGLSWAVDRKA